MDFKDHQIIISQQFKALGFMKNRCLENRPNEDYLPIYQQIATQAQSAFQDTNYTTFMVLSNLIGLFIYELSPYGYPESLKKTNLKVSINRESFREIPLLEEPIEWALFGGKIILSGNTSMSGDVHEPISYFYNLDFINIRNWNVEDFNLLTNNLNQLLPPRI